MIRKPFNGTRQYVYEIIEMGLFDSDIISIAGISQEQFKVYVNSYRHKEYQKEYSQRPKVKKRYEQYLDKPEVKKRKQEYDQMPEVKKRKQDYSKKKWQEIKKRPELKKKHDDYQQEYLQRPDVINSSKKQHLEYRRLKREAEGLIPVLLQDENNLTLDEMAKFLKEARYKHVRESTIKNVLNRKLTPYIARGIVQLKSSGKYSLVKPVYYEWLHVHALTRP